MLDNIKFRTFERGIIDRLQTHPDFVVCKPRTSSYFSICQKDFGVKLSFDFRKAFENGRLVGFSYLDINISPHYHYNHYRHNGNDLTPKNCIKTITEIFSYIGIEYNEYNALKVVNLEFGINIIPDTDIKDLINGLYYSQKTPFMVYDEKEKPYFKETERKETRHKEIKAYAKGIQCQTKLNAPEIDINTFRFEVKTKKSRKTKSLGIDTATDLINIAKYSRLGEELIKEWQYILLINLTPDLSGLKPDGVRFVKQGKNIDFWEDIATNKHRNTFGTAKEKYYRILKGNNQLHHLIKLQIIDKIFNLLNCANSPQKTLIKSVKQILRKTPDNKIKCEIAHSHTEQRCCFVTGLPITMQKPNSKFLCSTGLKWYSEKEPETYRNIKFKYLAKDKQNLEPEKQFYYIAHNIRNHHTNKIHNYNSYRQRNFHPNQLQLNFN